MTHLQSTTMYTEHVSDKVELRLLQKIRKKYKTDSVWPTWLNSVCFISFSIFTAHHMCSLSRSSYNEPIATGKKYDCSSNKSRGWREPDLQPQYQFALLLDAVFFYCFLDNLPMTHSLCKSSKICQKETIANCKISSINTRSGLDMTHLLHKMKMNS